MLSKKIREGPINVLLVEDNPSHAELIMRSLEEHPVSSRITHLSDGEAALDFLFARGSYQPSDRHFRPHLVLLDLRLPKIDGFEVLREIRTSKTMDTMPVIVLTTSQADADVCRAYEHRANSYLVKPLDFDEFSGLMKDLGYYWLSRNHLPDQASSATG